MSRPLERLKDLCWNERLQLVFLLLLVPLAHGLLATLGYARSRHLLESLSPGNQPEGRPVSNQDRKAAERLASLAALAGRRGAVTATCLRQALVVYWLLRWRRLAPTLRIGVRKADTGLDAHAWVELDNQPLSSNGRDYATFGKRPT